MNLPFQPSSSLLPFFPSYLNLFLVLIMNLYRVVSLGIVSTATAFQLQQQHGRRPGRVLTRCDDTTSDMRKEYSEHPLLENEIPSNPYQLFLKWFQEAVTSSSSVVEPNAMCLSTVGQDYKPSARMVLLKGHDERGFVWNTNYQSRKGNDMALNKYAALTFFWGELERSIRIEGTVETVSDAESTAYFYSRPRSSQIGAWSSNQSREISSRIALDEQEEQIKQRFQEMDVIPKPEHWGGYRLVPTRIEFWKGRASRLHDRIVYTKETPEKEKEEEVIASMNQAIWSIKRLQP